MNSRGSRGFEIDDAVLTVTEREAARVEYPLNRRMLGVILLFFLFGSVVLGVRVFFLNVVQGREYRLTAERNSIRSMFVPAPRGIIYDRRGTALVRNVPDMSLILVPADLPRDPSVRETLRFGLADMFRRDGDDMDLVFSQSGTDSVLPVVLVEHVTEEEALLFETRARDFPGISLLATAERDYVDSTIFAHVLGYEGKIRKEELENHPGYLLTDSIGKQGLERSYESVLRGMHGQIQTEVNATGKSKRDLGIVSPRPGSDLVLNIDADLQKRAYDALEETLRERDLKEGAVVAVDPRDGAILALVSYPSFDNNLFSGGIAPDRYAELVNDPEKPLFNRAVSGEYPPGSTIKPFLAAAALSEGTITESTQVESRGGISVGRFTFGDWKVHGFTDVRRAIAVSSDVFFYAVGGGWAGVQGLGMDRMKEYENRFGFGAKTGIDLPGETDGLIPDPEWKQEKIGERWYVGDDYHAAIGQGFVLTTPIQLAMGVAAIANGGTLYEPHVVSQIRNPDGAIVSVPPKVARTRFIDASILEVIREGMRETVTEGTAQSLRDIEVPVAGKTGTAQFGVGNRQTHGWFESFAPYDHPEIVLVVLVEGQGEEGYNAVPITQKIYDWYFSQERRGSAGG